MIDYKKGRYPDNQILYDRILQALNVLEKVYFAILITHIGGFDNFF
jgi:hypothetical protein